MGAAAALAVVLGLTGCGEALPPQAFDGRSPVFSPEQVFSGETCSRGVLEVAGGAPSERFAVVGHGRVLPDGRFRLDQSVTFDGRAPRERTWLIRRLDPHHYVADLTDASGPVRADAYGDLFHLRYRVKGVPLGAMEQWLYLQPDGRTVMNEGVVRVAGVAVRRLSERITRSGEGTPGC